MEGAGKSWNDTFRAIAERAAAARRCWSRWDSGRVKTSAVLSFKC